jgi:hypothetical protein
LSGSFLSRFRHYRNLDKTENRLRRLLGDFQFGTMEALVARLPTEVGGSVGPALELPYCW